MNEKIKIKISEEAYNTLVDILSANPEYSHIRLLPKDGCCKSAKLDLVLDIFEEKDIVDKIDNLPIIYDKTVVETFKEVTLVYRNASFMIKTVPIKETIKDCSTCTSGCGSKSGCGSGHSGSCNGCKRDG